MGAPCDPLLLAVGAGQAPAGLTQEVDWRLGGCLARLVDTGLAADGVCVLLPESALLPAGRLVLAPLGIGLADLSEAVAQLFGSQVGLCPEDFGFSESAARRVFGDRAVLFKAPAT